MTTDSSDQWDFDFFESERSGFTAMAGSFVTSRNGVTCPACVRLEYLPESCICQFVASTASDDYAYKRNSVLLP